MSKALRKGGADMASEELVWKYGFKGRAWQGEEAHGKYLTAPEKIELFKGKILSSEDERLQMLRLLIENVGLCDTIEATAGAKEWQYAAERILFEKQRAEFEYFEEHDLPLLVLALRETETMKSGREWKKIAHQTAGIGCRQHYFWGIVLPMHDRARVAAFELARDYYDSCLGLMGRPPLEKVNAYRDRLRTAFGVDCEYCYDELEEGFYPIDCTPENLVRLSPEVLPENLDEFIEITEANRFPLIRHWRLYILAENSD
jgi:hypothetical protein